MNSKMTATDYVLWLKASHLEGMYRPGEWMDAFLTDMTKKLSFTPKQAAQIEKAWSQQTPRFRAHKESAIQAAAGRRL